MGPYDQNKKLELKLQLPDSNLDFQKYAEFHHDSNQCFDFSLKCYERFNDLAKIDSYQIAAKIVDIDESESDSDESDHDKKVYSCQFGKCLIPCPCPQCHLDYKQCPDHKIQHPSLFDESKHLISIKSSEEFCLEKRFFKKS